MVTIHIGIEAGSLGIDRYLTHQACLLQSVQVVVYGSAGRPRVPPVDREENLLRGWVHGMLHEILHDEETLRRTSQSISLEGVLNFCHGLKLELRKIKRFYSRYRNF
jgi:hypothetical protein